MAQQVAAREQLNQLLGVMLATLLDEITREHAIDDRADGEAAADEQPSGADAKAEMVKLDRPIEGEFDRESAYQSARSKGENAAEQSFGYRDIKTHRYPDHGRGGGCQPKQRSEKNLFH